MLLCVKEGAVGILFFAFCAIFPAKDSGFLKTGILVILWYPNTIRIVGESIQPILIGDVGHDKFLCLSVSYDRMGRDISTR